MSNQKNQNNNEKKYKDYVDEISVNLSAMRKWAVQYALHAKILTPSSLVEGVKSDLVQALENYNTD